MRKRARSFPEIIIESDILDSPYACYRSNDNTIRFVNLPREEDDYYLSCLNHEIAHWAQMLYLTDEESHEMHKAYKESRGKTKSPFLEWINPYPALAYNHKKWEKKYKHKYFNIEEIDGDD